MNEQSSFDEFLLEEYRNIASAHFKSNETISNFFKYYLTIYSIPISIVALLLKIDVNGNLLYETGKGSNSPLFFIGLLFILISIIGSLIYLHVLNLHHDSIFYARTINGVRRYFLDNETRPDIQIKHNYLVLPSLIAQPSYRNFQYFGPITIAFCLFNLSYLIIGLFFIGLSNNTFILDQQNIIWVTNFQVFVKYCVFIVLLILSHIVLYFSISRYREFNYLRSNTIGIDIDGVLNKHTTQFCEFLRKNTGKILNPEEISAIPVRDIPNKNLFAEDELRVFNDPEYWISMPPIEEAAGFIDKIRKAYSLKVFIFTSRGWPSGRGSEDLQEVWKNKTKQYIKESGISKIDYFRSWIRNFLQLRIFIISFLEKMNGIFKKHPKNADIKRITKTWLLKNKFNFDFLLIEKGNENVKDPSAHIFNRFYVSQNQPIKFFVEDDLLKAKKLSYICDYIFLIDQPYNKYDQLPQNIIRVTSWNDIYNKIREIW